MPSFGVAFRFGKQPPAVLKQFTAHTFGLGFGSSQPSTVLERRTGRKDVLAFLSVIFFDYFSSLSFFVR